MLLESKGEAEKTRPLHSIVLKKKGDGMKKRVGHRLLTHRRVESPLTAESPSILVTAFSLHPSLLQLKDDHVFDSACF